MIYLPKPERLSHSANCIFSPHNLPILRVRPGEIVQVETYDAFGDQLTPDFDLKKLLESGKEVYDNPVTGPIYIEGAEPGDTLAVDIMDIKIREFGLAAISPGVGALDGWLSTSPAVTKFLKIENGTIHYRTDSAKDLTFPAKPFLGVVGVSPPLESISTVTPFQHGGNMDVADVCPGNRLFLPVGVKGGLFCVGDVHASQGDGEICGNAVEVSAQVTFKFDILKNKTIRWPRIESNDEIMTVCSSKPLEDAARCAFRELIQWLDEYGISTNDAYILLSLAARARIAQIVDPLYTVVAKIAKEIIA